MLVAVLSRAVSERNSCSLLSFNRRSFRSSIPVKVCKRFDNSNRSVQSDNSIPLTSSFSISGGRFTATSDELEAIETSVDFLSSEGVQVVQVVDGIIDVLSST